MSNKKRAKVLSVIVGLMIFFISTGSAWALLDREPFEFENYYTYGGAKDGVYTLSYVGIGGGKCDGDDRRFKININRSYNGSDWKLFSSNTRYQNTPTRRPIYGYDLGTTNAHICVGKSEFLYPFSYWTTSDVSYYVYAWRR